MLAGGGSAGSSAEELIHVEDFGTVLGIISNLRQVNANIRNVTNSISNYTNKILSDWDDGRASTSFGNSLKENIASLDTLTGLVERICSTINQYIDEVKAQEAKGN